MKRHLAIAFASIALAVGAHAADKAGPAVIPDTPAGQLLQRHLSAFIENDLEKVVSDYTADAVLVTADATYTGPAQIRVFFRNLIQEFPKGASTLALDSTRFVGDTVFFTWHGKTPTLDVPFATDTMVLRGGKIVKQTFAGILQHTRP
jgi:hypothetical protein